MPGPIDTHVHVFDPARFPYRPDAEYVPGAHETATAAQLDGVLDAHGMAGAVLVAPTSGYGADIGCFLDALARSGGRHRGIAVVDPWTDERSLDRLATAGVVGVRFDLFRQGAAALEGGLLERVAARGLIAQLLLRTAVLPEIAPRLVASGARLVVDHAGAPDPAGGLDDPGFRALLALADTGLAWIKLSGPFRFAREPFPYADADPFLRALAARFGPERCLWGSDWPYVRMTHRVDYGPSLAALARWVPDAAARRAVLETTPRALFGWPA